MNYEQTIASLKRQIDDLDLTMRKSLQEKERNLYESSNRVITELEGKVALMSQ